MTGFALLEALDVSFSYAEPGKTARAALSGIQLGVHSGDFVCLLGPSGCGKTTLLKLLGGFLSPSGGAVRYLGQTIVRPRREIMMIFQEHNLYPWLTVEGNIAFGPKRQGIPRAEIARRMDEILDVVGLGSARRLYPHQLSGGMRQRVAIARALVTKPDALLLDEPFTALDVALRRRLQQFLRDTWSRTKTTMIMVTHDIEEAILVSQRIVLLGGSPSSIVETIDTSDSALKDRFAPEFLALEARLEARMGDSAEDDLLGAPSERRASPRVSTTNVLVEAHEDARIASLGER
jgi:ABC-type nitrate/sulfonate/bicarbonate transport system ATPase subunit